MCVVVVLAAVIQVQGKQSQSKARKCPVSSVGSATGDTIYPQKRWYSTARVRANWPGTKQRPHRQSRVAAERSHANAKNRIFLETDPWDWDVTLTPRCSVGEGEEKGSTTGIWKEHVQDFLLRRLPIGLRGASRNVPVLAFSTVETCMVDLTPSQGETDTQREKAVLAVEEDEDEVEEPFFFRFSNSLPPHLARCTIALALMELWSNANGPTNLDGRGNLPS